MAEEFIVSEIEKALKTFNLKEDPIYPKDVENTIEEFLTRKKQIFRDEYFPTEAEFENYLLVCCQNPKSTQVREIIGNNLYLDIKTHEQELFKKYPNAGRKVVTNYLKTAE